MANVAIPQMPMPNEKAVSNGLQTSATMKPTTWLLSARMQAASRTLPDRSTA